MFGFGLPELIVIFIMLLGVGGLVVWALCLVEIIRNEYTGNNKIIWLLLVLLIPLLGIILYYLIGKNQRVEAGVSVPGRDKFCMSCGVRMTESDAFCHQCGNAATVK